MADVEEYQDSGAVKGRIQLVEAAIDDILNNALTAKLHVPAVETSAHNEPELIDSQLFNELWVLNECFKEAKIALDNKDIVVLHNLFERFRPKMEKFNESYPNTLLYIDMSQKLDEYSQGYKTLLKNSYQKIVDINFDSLNGGYFKFDKHAVSDADAISELYSNWKTTITEVGQFIDLLIDSKVSDVLVKDESLVFVPGVPASVPEFTKCLQTMLEYIDTHAPNNLREAIPNRYGAHITSQILLKTIPRLYPEDINQVSDFQENSLACLLPLKSKLIELNWMKENHAFDDFIKNFPSSWSEKRRLKYLGDLRSLYTNNTPITEESRRKLISIPSVSAKTYKFAGLEDSSNPSGPSGSSGSSGSSKPSEPSEPVEPEEPAEDTADEWEWNEDEDEDEDEAEDEKKDNDNEIVKENEEEKQEQKAETVVESSAIDESSSSLKNNEDNGSVVNLYGEYVKELGFSEKDPFFTLYRAITPLSYTNSSSNLWIFSDTLYFLQHINQEIPDLKEFANSNLSEYVKQNVQEFQYDLLPHAMGDKNLTGADNIINRVLAIAHEANDEGGEELREFVVCQLIELVAFYIINEVEGKRDIAADESSQLAELIKKLESLAVVVKDVNTSVPSWNKFQMLGQILASNLANIGLLFEQNMLLDFTPQELTSLIESLFVDSARRNKLTNEILQH